MWWAVAVVAVVAAVAVVAFVVLGRTASPAEPGATPPPTPQPTGTLAPGTSAGGIPDNLLRVTWPDTGSLRVLFVGDSIMRGAFASTRDLAFPALITDELDGHGPVLPEFAGASGLGAAALMQSVYSTTYDHDLVIVEAGTNDVPGGYPEGFAVQYAALLDAVIARNPDAGLLCLGSWADTAAAHPFDVVARDACTERDGKYTGISQFYADPLNRSTIDGFHPSNAGHEHIAEVALAHLYLRGEPG
jgi:acyl-CoA thioesterase-1